MHSSLSKLECECRLNGITERIQLAGLERIGTSAE